MTKVVKKWWSVKSICLLNFRRISSAALNNRAEIVGNSAAVAVFSRVQYEGFIAERAVQVQFW